MKSIDPAAMEAIEAGEAIVTGAVEITPTTQISYSTVGTYDISATTDVATTTAGGLLVGELISGFDPTDYIRFTLPAGQTFEGWKSADLPAVVYQNAFDVILDEDSAQSYRVSDAGTSVSSTLHVSGYPSAAAARTAFISETLTGASTYRLYILDSPTADNALGVSVRVERGIPLVGTGTPIRVWGGYGPIEIDGQEYLGVGDRAIAQQTSGAIGGVAQGITLSLSGVEADLVGLIDAQEIKGGSCVLRRMIFASDGKTLLDAHVFDRGRVDTIETPETVGGTATIQVMVESAARGLGRNLSRQRADSDQRLINSSDGYFKNTAYAGEKMLYWGGRKPSRTGDGTGGSSGVLWL